MKSQIKTLWIALFATSFLAIAVEAQNHLTPRGNQAPGALGKATQSKRQNVFGYVQPTELIVPKNSRIAYYDKNKFAAPQKNRIKLGLRIGDVYRFKVTMIEGFEGLELYPSVEVIDRLYPAQDKYLDFPVPMQLTQEDLEDALKGQLITKIIYIEDPSKALPVKEIKDSQRVLVVGVGEDPLLEAENLGRPVAILRLGSRTPDERKIAVFGAPVVTDYATLPTKPLGDGARWSPDGKPWPLDEYLFDGGDKNLKARISHDFTVQGVDVEDTIVHFDTLEGERKVTETNRVPIYAPRFAAIQKKYGIVITHQNEQFADVANREGLLKGQHTDTPSMSTQQYQPRGAQSTRSSSIFRDQTQGLPVSNSLKAGEFVGNLKLYEDFQIIKLGRMKNVESLRLNIGLQAAQEWDHYTAVQVVVDNKKTNVAKRVQSAQELRTYKPQPGSSKIRIVKLASKKDAKPGDIVEFTLRFDNVGTKKVGNVTIIDNLTTRLELVPNSSNCNLKHDFLTQNNEKDSLLLRWEIVDPLEPGQGGVVRFKCIVR